MRQKERQGPTPPRQIINRNIPCARARSGGWSDTNDPRLRGPAAPAFQTLIQFLARARPEAA